MKTRNVLFNLTAAMFLIGITHQLPAQSFVATYNFAQVTTSSGTTDPTLPPTVSGVNFGYFTSTGASLAPNAAGRFSFTAQPQGGVNGIDDFSQFTGSLNLGVYFEVTVTPLVLVQLQLDSLSFTVQRSGTGIRSYAVRSSLDGYFANLDASINPANANLGVGPGNEFRVLSDSVSTAQNGSTVTLGGPFASVGNPVSFRFYGWNAEGSGGTFSLDNVTFSGRADSIPEPGVAALLIGSLTALGISQRGKK